MNLVTVSFKSEIIEVVEEIQSIVVKDICNNLGLGFSPQYNKLKADESFESKLIKVQTNGGLQEVFTIPLSKLNGWLFSINPNKVKPEVKEKLIEYKNECFDVLNNYFNKGIAINEKFHQRQILGYKSQIAQHNNKIEHLKDCLKIQAIEYERKLALPHFSKDEKIDILLKSSNELISNKNIDRCSFISALQNQLKFYSSYVQALKTSGTKLEQFSIKQIEDYKKRTVTAEINQHETKEKYNDMINQVKVFIDASNQISLLKPI